MTVETKKIAFSGIKWTSLGSIGKASIKFLQTVILVRILPQDDFGLMAVAFLIIQFTNMFADMGFSSAILHKKDATQKEYSSLYWFTAFTSTILYGLLMSLMPLIVWFYKNEPRSSELYDIIPILGLNLLFITIGRQHRTIMQKEFRFKDISLIEIVGNLVGLPITLILAYGGYGVYSLVVGTLVPSFLINVCFLIFNIRRHPIKLYYRYSKIKVFLKIGSYTLGSSLLDFLAREIDVIILSRTLGFGVSGGYSIIKQLVIQFYSIINPLLISVLTPLLSHIQDQKDRLRNSYLSVIHKLGFIYFPLYLLIVINSQTLILYLFGHQYLQYFPILILLASSYGIQALGSPVGSLQIATGRTDLGFRWTIIRLSLTSVFIYVGSLFGLFYFAFSYFLLTLINIILIWRLQIFEILKISFWSYFRQFIEPYYLWLE